MSDTQGLDSNSRRGFHLAVIYGLQAVMGAALAIPAAVYLLFPPRSKKEDQWVEVAELTKLQPGVPEEIVFRRNRVDGWKIANEKTSAWVVKKSDTEVVAYAPNCTHLGCAFHWEQRTKTFLCPCHTSNFGVDGKVIDGPAPRPLDRYEVRVDGGKVLIGSIQPASEV